MEKNVSLYYNPYLRQTIIKLNDKDPKNHDKSMDIKSKSFIVNYQDKRLQDWMEDLPELLNYEMNGYDFNLYFHGRQVEFKQLEKIFNDLIEKKFVELHLVKVYQDVKNKCQLADEMYKYIDGCQIDCFKETTNEFINDSQIKSLFDESSKFNFYVYPIGVCENINEVKTNLLDDLSENSYYKDFVIERIDSLEEKNFKNIPTVLVVLIEQTINMELQDKIYEVMNQKGLKHEQVFFYSNNPQNKRKLESLAKDLKFKHLQLIDKNSNDQILKDFLDVYPMTSYIRDCIKSFDKLNENLYAIYYEEIKETQHMYNLQTNEMDVVDESIKRCDEALRKLTVDTFIPGYKPFEKFKDAFIESILVWQINKPDITSDKLMEKYLGYFKNEIFDKEFNIFKTNVEKGFFELKKVIEVENMKILNITGLPQPNINTQLIDTQLVMSSYEEFEHKFKNLLRVFNVPNKSEEREVKTSGFNFSTFVGMGDTDNKRSNASKEDTKTVIDNTWVLESWRQKAIAELNPIIIKICDWYESALKYYDNYLIKCYEGVIETEKERLLKRRQTLVNGMGAGQRKYQEIIDYYKNFEKKLNELKEKEHE